MESLVRFLIASTLIYLALPMACCKVLKQLGEHETEISASIDVDYGRMNGTTPEAKLNETSIKHMNDTLTSLSGFNVNSLAHM